MNTFISKNVFAVILAVCVLSNSVGAETLNVARTAIPPSRGIPFTAAGQPGIGIWSQIYDTLARLDDQGNVVPALATRWEAISPTRWVFHLRSGVKFQNGEDFDSSAVAATVALLQSDEGSRFYTASEVQGVALVETPDPHTVIIETKEPDPILPRRTNLIWILPPIALAERGVDSFSQTPIGSGPFRLIDWGDTTGAVRLEAFAASWRASVGVDKLLVYVMQDPITRLQALRSGQVDVAEQLSIEDIGQINGERYQTYQRTSPVVSGITFRVIGNEDSPVADKRIRQALNMAVDRAAIADYLFQGTVQPSGQGAAPSVNGHNANVKPWPYDPDRARKMLEDAGFDFDRTLKVHVATGIASNDALVFQTVAQNIQAIGVKVELRSIPYANWLTSFLTSEWGDVDAFSLAWDNSAYYDAIRAETYTGCYKAQPFFCAPETQPLFEAISVEMNSEKRTALLWELMATLHEVAPAIWLMTGAEYAASSAAVQGLNLTPRGVPYESVSVGGGR